VELDPKLYAVEYAFNAAFRRIRKAETDDDRMAELSNVVHHLYRFHELCALRLGAGFDATAPTLQLRAAKYGSSNSGSELVLSASWAFAWR
jgi:hypothetical protein